MIFFLSLIIFSSLRYFRKTPLHAFKLVSPLVQITSTYQAQPYSSFIFLNAFTASLQSTWGTLLFGADIQTYRHNQSKETDFKNLGCPFVFMIALPMVCANVPWRFWFGKIIKYPMKSNFFLLPLGRKQNQLCQLLNSFKENCQHVLWFSCHYHRILELEWSPSSSSPNRPWKKPPLLWHTTEKIIQVFVLKSPMRLRGTTFQDNIFHL